MVSRKEEPDGGVPTGGGGNGAGESRTQHTQGGGDGAGNERGEQGEGLGGHDIPESLRAGPRVGAESTNPFVRAQHTGNSPALGSDTVANPWASDEEKGGRGTSVPDFNAPGSRVPGSGAPDTSVPPASNQHHDPDAAGQFQNLNITGQSSNPWEDAVEPKSIADEKPQPYSQPVPPSFDKEDEAWPSATKPTTTPPGRPPRPLIDVDDTNESSNWNDDQRDLFRTPTGEKVVTEETENAWEEGSGESSRRQAIQTPDVPHKELPREDGGSEPTGAGEQQSGVIDATGRETSSQRPVPSQPPNLPPRNTGDPGANASPPRHEALNSEEQRKETYGIKKITWFDARSTENPVITPILTQNANGPCPLLALVNALTISTPPDLITPLLETLRTREQISLELLLNAVLDELMSRQREDGVEELPDITDLYTFLITLHTGMNVNPSFFPPAATNLANDPRRSMSHVHPSEREETIPGTFEQTREIMLYGTFLIPLIHGWLPEPGSDAQAALARSARTYEDAQHLLFREEELEMKFIGDGLTFEEQATLDDIMTIRSFLSSSSTQLTSSGLETIRRALAPGSVAILFRNDHFSTLYKHPQTEELMHLVTDMGLAGHEEIVWESLPDINGEHCSFYSGDFRPVGGDTHSRQAASDGAGRQRGPQASAHANAAPSAGHRRVPSSSVEQEDHDLALALQMQEEENQRHEEETARRRRESGNTQQQGASYTHNASSNDISVSRFDGSSGGPRSGNGRRPSQAQAQAQSPPPQGTNSVSPPVSPGEALPSYEQAATQPRFEPPANHPAFTGADQGGRQPHGIRAQAQRPAQPTVGRGNRRQSQPGRNRERDRDCVVM